MQSALINDTHHGVRNDSELFDRHIEKFYREIFFPTIDKLGINHIIHLGDVFDRRKYINFKTAYTFRKMFLDEVRKRYVSRGLTIDFFAGNHDVYHKNTNEVNALHELIDGKLPKECCRIFIDPVTVNINGYDIAYFPWITASNYEKTIDHVKNTKAFVAMGHFEFKGFEVLRGIINEEGMDPGLFEKFATVLSGHYHFKSSANGIDYLGNQYDLTWSDYGDQRGFHIFDHATRDLEFIENPNKMFVKLFYDDEKNDYNKFDFEPYKEKCVKLIVLNRKNQFVFEKLLDGLYAQNLADLSIIEEHEQKIEDNSVDLAQDTLEIVNQYVDTLDVTCDKNNLKKMIHEIYIEALSVE
jgi:hypothetical protein